MHSFAGSASEREDLYSEEEGSEDDSSSDDGKAKAMPLFKASKKRRPKASAATKDSKLSETKDSKVLVATKDDSEDDSSSDDGKTMPLFKAAKSVARIPSFRRRRRIPRTRPVMSSFPQMRRKLVIRRPSR